MCRLFGFVAPAPVTVEETIGAEGVDQFARLALLHGDGWGTAFWPATPGHPAQSTYRSERAAHLDPLFAEHTHALPAMARLLHLRWASPGLQVRPANTHPFTAGGLSLAHNGSLMPPHRIDPELDADVMASLVGTTDSERYLGLIRTQVREDPTDLVGAVGRAVMTLRKLYPLASLNAMVLSDAELIVIHSNSPDDVPTAAELIRGDTIPPDHAEAYYLMRWRRSENGTLAFTSTGLAGQGWNPLANNTITRVGLVDLDMTTTEVAAVVGR